MCPHRSQRLSPQRDETDRDLSTVKLIASGEQTEAISLNATCPRSNSSPAVGEHSPIRHLFVYGTLRPGDVRWHMLEPFVIGEGSPDTVSGELFDTGLDYPAAIFGQVGVIQGRTYELRLASQQRCLSALDIEEDTVDGLYRRVEVTTGCGIAAWSYAYGSGLNLTLIPSGDWLLHQYPKR